MRLRTGPIAPLSRRLRNIRAGQSMNLPQGVTLSVLKTHADPRGTLTEIFREDWAAGFSPRQWNVSHSHANVLRGLHLHLRHQDYLVLLQGRMSIALYDARPASPTSVSWNG